MLHRLGIYNVSLSFSIQLHLSETETNFEQGVSALHRRKKDSMSLSVMPSTQATFLDLDISPTGRKWRDETGILSLVLQHMPMA
jgi:hypothetical protein